MRRAASWAQPLQVRSGPRGARTMRETKGLVVAAVIVLPAPIAGLALPYYIAMDAPPRSSSILELTGGSLTLDDAEAILSGEVIALSLGAAARKRVEKARRCLEALMATGATIYGVNTG